MINDKRGTYDRVFSVGLSSFCTSCEQRQWQLLFWTSFQEWWYCKQLWRGDSTALGVKSQKKKKKGAKKWSFSSPSATCQKLAQHHDMPCFFYCFELPYRGRQNNGSQRGPHSNPWNLQMCYVTWRKRIKGC